MAKKGELTKQGTAMLSANPTDCPFREFRDNELSSDSWGMSPTSLRMSHLVSKSTLKSHSEHVWVDDQTQPLPRSARQYLHGWIRAEDLALSRWEAEVAIFEDNDGSKMNVIDIQLSHAQVLMRSSFCRRVLSFCYILEMLDTLVVEHQWELFNCSLPPEGWRARCHIYSPGLKSGGGAQHRPTLSKNGCYLVRLYYLGAWRCVWVSDLVPVDATDSPLLPFSPLLSKAPVKPMPKQSSPAVTAPVVYLWPMLLCKALLKLAAPDMTSDETVDANCCEDEPMLDFDILHALTGGLNVNYCVKCSNLLWEFLLAQGPGFSWDDDSETQTGTIKSKGTKKPNTKDFATVRRGSVTTLLLSDTKGLPPYTLPGITPGHEMDLLVTMVRDLPLKKPLPEPDVPLWKTYRWVDWARAHGLYSAYECPRTRFLKLVGLLKLSYAPHLLDVQSTESITFRFREEHERTNPPIKKLKDNSNKPNAVGSETYPNTLKEELREWMLYDVVAQYTKKVSVLYYPSMYQFTSAARKPPVRVTKVPLPRALDIPAPHSAPLYLQIDAADENVLRVSLSALHPRVLSNCGMPVSSYVEKASLLLEVFEWFVDCELPRVKAFIHTCSYDAVEVKFKPGRHFCRIWVHSHLDWSLMLLSESSLVLGPRDVIQSAAVHDCPWASRFLTGLAVAFANWIKASRDGIQLTTVDKEFYKSYQPDLEWDVTVVGYNKALLHWMFRQALQSVLLKHLLPNEYRASCVVLKRFFHDPDFGYPPRPQPVESLRYIALLDPCDCVLPEAEEIEALEDEMEEQQIFEEQPVVEKEIMAQLLIRPTPPATSNVCELATEEVPCGVLKQEREKIIRQHEAATVIQAYWRGTWARKCIKNTSPAPGEVVKCLLDNIFGNLESLSQLMNEFFAMYPSTKYAYSVASALSGSYGLQQHSGTALITQKCKWIPFFQGVFNCHALVKVHFDVQSSLQYCTFAVYNNDTGRQLAQAYNSHRTFDFQPNDNGYTVMGHGTLSEPVGISMEAHWQLTVLSSISNVFHVCDREMEICRELPLQGASKLHVEEVFIPNRRNILGGIQIVVTKQESVSFRAAVTSPELEIEATLRTKSSDGQTIDVGKCTGIGELFWIYINLDPSPPLALSQKKSMSRNNIDDLGNMNARPQKGRQLKYSIAGSKTRSTTKVKDAKVTDAKQYWIEVTAPSGWPLTLAQWKRVDEVRNSQQMSTVEVSKKSAKEKPSSAKDKESAAMLNLTMQPQPGDAYVELECALVVGGGCVARRDDDRDVALAAALRNWDAVEHGRNQRGALLRKEFCAEFMEPSSPNPPSEIVTFGEEFNPEEAEGELNREQETQLLQGPTPVTESAEAEVSEESEEELKYLTMPEQLRHKFIPLPFVPLCTREKTEEDCVVMTEELAMAAHETRREAMMAAVERARQLQVYNKQFVLQRQIDRCHLLETLLVDSDWHGELADVLEERDDAIAREALSRTLSATKKKQEAKKK
ncbi:androglobin-like [Leptidea sinapis]|uniref:androglobin-like n=1 Tax=Leptidea sinapis TaxID=189913 RepID=UPI0021C44780|nr:androglobin-like [Leptidea sinapis]